MAKKIAKEHNGVSRNSINHMWQGRYAGTINESFNNIFLHCDPFKYVWFLSLLHF